MSILRKAQKMGLKYDNNLWTEQEDSILRDNYQTKTVGQITKLLDRTPTAIKSRALKIGLQKTESWDENDDSIITEHFPHLTNKEIQKRYLPHRTIAAIQTRAGNLGVTKTLKQRSKAHRKVHFNERFFSNGVVSPDHAVLLGYIYADGSIVKNSLRFECAIEDLEYLEQIKNLLNSDDKIRIRDRRKEMKPKNAQKSCYLTLRSIALINDLKKLGVDKRKTKIMQPPVDRLNGFEIDFIRGFFEGDGSVFISNRKLGVDIASSNLPFLNWVQETMMGKMDLSKTKMSKTAGDVYHIRYNGNRQVKKIGKFLYDSYNKNRSIIFMKRKYKKFFS